MTKYRKPTEARRAANRRYYWKHHEKMRARRKAEYLARCGGVLKREQKRLRKLRASPFVTANWPAPVKSDQVSVER